MRNDRIHFLFLGIVIGGLIVWVLNQNTVGWNQMMDMRQLDRQNNVRAINNIDQHFIEQMIPHHEDAITMAEIALEKAQTDEVKQLAQNIITTQTKENEQMVAWYKEWFGRELPTGDEVMNVHGMGRGMHMGMMGSEVDITNLENSADFDREFVEHMIPHHQMAVMMASMLKNGTTRPEMSQLADNIITAQTNEIDDMRRWLQEWK